MDEKKRIKMAIIAGASHAMKFKMQNPESTDERVLQHISKEMENILKNVDDED